MFSAIPGSAGALTVTPARRNDSQGRIEDVLPGMATLLWRSRVVMITEMRRRECRCDAQFC